MSKNENVVRALERLKLSTYHFGETEWTEALHTSSPRPHRKDWLMQEYFSFLDELKARLVQNYTQEQLVGFFKDKSEALDSEQFLPLEYQLMLLKYNELSYWFFGSSYPLEYYQKHNDIKKYSC